MNDVIKAGAKVRHFTWSGDDHVLVTAVGKQYFLGMLSWHEDVENYWAIDDTWEPYVEQPKPIGYVNLYKHGECGIRHPSREDADRNAGGDRTGIAVHYSDGGWKLEVV